MELFRETSTTLTVILVNGLHIRGELARASRKRDALATGERKALEHMGGMLRERALRVVRVGGAVVRIPIAVDLCADFVFDDLLEVVGVQRDCVAKVVILVQLIGEFL